MKIDKTKRDEAVQLLNMIHDIYPYSSDTLAAFVDTLLAAIVPDVAIPTTPAQPSGVASTTSADPNAWSATNH